MKPEDLSTRISTFDSDGATIRGKKLPVRRERT